MTKIFVLAFLISAAIIQLTFAQDMFGGFDAIAIGGNIQGTTTSTTNLISIDGYPVEDQISPGDNIDLSVLYAEY
ncbi:MAG: hypothetical protein MUO26_14965 [Methanotrichaceae archaeon]|nr:hypothetical protein [Methanotrichaceae archaeon]